MHFFTSINLPYFHVLFSLFCSRHMAWALMYQFVDVRDIKQVWALVIWHEAHKLLHVFFMNVKNISPSVVHIIPAFILGNRSACAFELCIICETNFFFFSFSTNVSFIISKRIILSISSKDVFASLFFLIFYIHWFCVIRFYSGNISCQIIF